MDTALIFYAFTAGMVATVNPCTFAMLPAYISYYLATGRNLRGRKRRGSSAGRSPSCSKPCWSAGC